MNTIMHIAHNGTEDRKSITGEDSAGIRLLFNVDNTELHLINGVTRRLQVVHSAMDNQSALEELVAAQKKVSAAIRVYEDRIYKRVPLDIA